MMEGSFYIRLAVRSEVWQTEKKKPEANEHGHLVGTRANPELDAEKGRPTLKGELNYNAEHWLLCQFTTRSHITDPP